MATTVHVDLGARSYDIHIGTGLLPRLGELSAGVLRGRAVLVATDAAVAPIYAGPCEQALAGVARKVGRAVVPAGEASKDGQWLFHLYAQAVEQGLDRKAVVVALGGGVVGDLAGFMAATYLRGIAYVQVPTTLLAMVDSAIGGKTGINLAQGKNLVGSFHQPSCVVSDLDTLRTLPPREVAAGLAEVVKYGVIWDAELFAYLERNTDAILRGEAAALEHIVAKSCAIKAEVVRRDEREERLRAILNFGHTLGHALETVTGYGHLLHGEAVAIGMVYAARLSAMQCGFPRRDAERLVRLLHALKLPTGFPGVSWPALRQVMGVDKKSAAGKPRFVLATRIGAVEPEIEVDEAVLQQAWQAGTEPGHHGF